MIMEKSSLKRSHGQGAQQSHKRQKKDPQKAKYRAQAAQTSGKGNVIEAGDVGMFVTSDKGREKAALREVEDLLEPYLGGLKEEGPDGEAARGAETEQVVGDVMDGEEAGSGETVVGEGAGVEGKTGTTKEPMGKEAAIQRSSIEDDIAAELQEINGPSSAASHDASRPGKQRPEINALSSTSQLGLITLDIPCVSFVRFPIPALHSSKPALDPVKIVLGILREAYNNPGRQRSRFIKRLTPVTKVRKVLSQGLDEVCRDILPPHFTIEADADLAGGEEAAAGNEIKGAGAMEGAAEVPETAGDKEKEDNDSSEPAVSGCRFKIDLTRRQSDHLSRDDIIETVAGHVNRIGEGKHKVDLKTWEKLILVEVYRGIVGMSVIDNGYEDWEGQLKRGNLAEVYTAARQRVEGDKKKD